eukprot:403355312
MIEDEEEVEEEEEEQISQEQLDDLLLKACKEDDIENAQLYLSKNASPTVEKDGWNPLLWAGSNGNEQIVRMLIKAGACSPYLNQNQEDLAVAAAQKMSSGMIGDEVFDPFVKPKDAQKVGKYTPLHWASYKGHYKVVWILLKEKMSPLDIDMHGNTAVHQASASGSKKVLECFLSRGVDVDVKNARGHTPLDLATQIEVKDLILKAQNTKKCVICKSKFDFKNIRYYCESCTRFLCLSCSTSQWVYESVESEERERPVCRCMDCLNKIKKSEEDLSHALKSMEYQTVDKVYSYILNNNIDIDVKLKHSAQVLHLKLEKELDIRIFIKSVDYVDDYKTILKSVKILNDKVEAARNLGVELDLGMIGDMNKCTSRLISERNLRFHMEMTKVPESDHDQVEKLKSLIEIAQENNVALAYRDNAEKLSQQMSGNIKAREILQMLLDYPEREYPVVEIVDPKKKKVKADEKEKKKKKKKKEPPFPMPEWAFELESVKSQVHQMENLLADAENLHLNLEFVQRVNQQLQRFKKEISFRWAQEEEARIEAELKKLKKNKKKK